jgi:Arc/MetJ family transcription regulator
MVVYTQAMKRLQILIDEDLDADLEREASRSGRSKGALVRDALRRQMKPAGSIERDAIFDLAGKASFEPVPPEQIDDVVYGDA